MDAENLITAFQTLGWKFRGRVGTKNFLVSCPFAYKFHKDGADNNPSMAVKSDPVNPSPAICNSCGIKGTLLSIIWKCIEDGQQIESGIYHKIKLLEIPRIEVPDVRVRNGQRGPIGKCSGSLAQDWESISGNFEFDKVPRFILERGLTKKTCREWGIGYDPKQTTPIFSVRNSARDLVGFVRRNLRDGAKDKYPGFPGFEKSKYLYGEDRVRERAGSPIILVEGMIDVPWVWQETEYPVLGCFGTILSDHQVDLLKDLCDYGLVLMFDNDDAGRRAKDRAMSLLSGRIQGGCWGVTWPRRGRFPGRRPKDQNDLNGDQIRVCIETRKFLC